MSSKLTQEKLENFYQKIQATYDPGRIINTYLSTLPVNPPGPGRPLGSKTKDKDVIIQECVDRLASDIARQCNKYNISDDSDITTEVDLVELANYTIVTVTSTVSIAELTTKGIEKERFIFMAKEKIKTSNKTSTSGQAQQNLNRSYISKIAQGNLLLKMDDGSDC